MNIFTRYESLIFRFKTNNSTASTPIWDTLLFPAAPFTFQRSPPNFGWSSSLLLDPSVTKRRI